MKLITYLLFFMGLHHYNTVISLGKRNLDDNGNKLFLIRDLKKPLL